MSANRVEVDCCKNCPFAVAIVEGIWCQHPELLKPLMIKSKIYDNGSSPKECPLGELLIVKVNK